MNDEVTVERGTISGVMDCGTIVRLFIETSGGVVVADADGNLWRRATAECGVRISDHIEFERTGWGGLAWFAPST
jgi:hypothetical protein